jgi:hypothetical protein
VLLRARTLIYVLEESSQRSKNMPKQVKKQVKKATPAKKPAKKAPAKKAPPVKKAAPPVVAPPPVVPAAPQPRKEADVIWDQIRNLPIQMFGLPDQIIAMHVTPVPVEPSKLYVTIRSSAALPSLEAAIAPAFQVELVDRWVVIRRAPAPIIPSKRG